MMKKLIVLTMVMLVALGVGAQAYTIQAIAGNSTFGSGMNQITFGTATTAVANNLPANTGTLAEVSLTGPAGDQRLQVWNVLAADAPLNNTWEMTLTAGGGYTGTDVALKIWAVNVATLPVADTQKFWAVSANGVEVGPRFQLMSAVTSKTTPAWSYDFQFEDWGNLKTTPLVLTLGEVPEPGSMVALMSGLVGLAGFVVRRRK